MYIMWVYQACEARRFSNVKAQQMLSKYLISDQNKT